MSRSLFAVVLMVSLLTCRVWAQEDDLESATASLQSVLSNLKESVSKMSLNNDQLAAHDNAMKDQIVKLQAQLGHLEAQGNLLSNQTDKLQYKDPGREQHIAELEEENLDLDHRIKKDQDAMKLIQLSLNQGYQEDQKLLLKLKGMQVLLPSNLRSSHDQLAAHRQKEKLKLMKMIYDSQSRQGALHGAILELQKNAPLLPAASALAHQQLLKEQVKDLEAQISSYPPEKFSPHMGDNQWDDTQLLQLEGELKSLEQNYSQLKGLMEQMGKKAQASRMTVSQHVEEVKLQGSLDDLNHQGAVLSVDLDDLRSQMIDLDKRKSRLEDMIHQLP